MNLETRLLLVSMIVLLHCVPDVPGQKQKHIIGDISEQRISNVAGLDERYQDKDRYRRKPTYLVQASKIGKLIFMSRPLITITCFSKKSFVLICQQSVGICSKVQSGSEYWVRVSPLARPPH